MLIGNTVGHLGYCLMTNHVHLVVVPTAEDALGLTMHDTHTAYAMYFNSLTQLNGHVWQGRFHSALWMIPIYGQQSAT
jgi:putative transposase